MHITFLRRLVLLMTSLTFLSLGSLVSAQSLKVMSWNLESGDSDLAWLTERMRDFQGVDIWGLSEVQNTATANSLRLAAQHNENGTFRRWVGTTGGTDRLVVIYNNSRLELMGTEELEDINIEDKVRAPLVAEFRVRSNGRRFLFMVNHLYRGSAEGRHEQSRLLNEWAQGQELPVIAVGDYNYDWNVNSGNHDDGYDLLTEGNVFRWVRPPTLVRTQCSYNSVLDFVFTAGAAQGWQASSEIKARNDDCPDDGEKSDHRPVEATFTMTSDGGPNFVAQPSVVAPEAATEPTTNEEIFRRVESIEAELRRLKELIRRRP